MQQHFDNFAARTRKGSTMALHNRISQKELKEQLLREAEQRRTISFYKYFPIADPALFRDELYKSLHALRVFGRIYVATEGINAQVSVPQKNLPAFENCIREIEGLGDVQLNTALDDNGKSFWVLKVKVRAKIVADGITDPAFNMNRPGQYIGAQDMNRLLEDPQTIVIDMRNHYEYEVGHFENAIEIPSDTFREQLPMAVKMMQDHIDKNIVMYCTGGIRCEKASAWMLHKGFQNVFHLKGGIIQYVRETKNAGLPGKFIGKNFVFDDRLGERVTEDVIAHCHQCGAPADVHVNCANPACHLLFIQCASCRDKYLGCCGQHCFEVLQLPIEQQKEIRRGKDKDRNIFNKSRARLKSTPKS